MTVPGQEQSAKTGCIQGHNTHKNRHFNRKGRYGRKGNAHNHKGHEGTRRSSCQNLGDPLYYAVI